MTWSNYDDVVGQLRAVGLLVDRGLEVNRWVRCKVEGGDAEKRGWYKLFEHGDLLTGAFGIWSANDPQKFKVELPKAERTKLSADEVAAIRERQKATQAAADAEIRRRQERAAAQAAVWWRKLADAGESGYMAKKGFAAGELFGARVSPSGNLVVPMEDAAGKKWGLQVIFPAKSRNGRDKDFTPPGLAKKGHFFQMGIVARGGIALLCEGFATGATLRKATGLPVVVAFDAGNLVPVAMALAKAHKKGVKILVCADDDYLTMANTGKNTGIDSGRTAAMAVDGAVVWPAFPGERPTDKKGPTDFNDLHVHPDGGLTAVRQQVEAAIATAGWTLNGRAMRAGIAIEGGGETPGAQQKGSLPAMIQVEDAVDRFAMIYGAGGTWFDSTEHMLVPKSDLQDILPEHGMRDMRARKRVVRLNEVGFDPGGTDPRIKCNLWGGWPTVPKAGTCSVLLELLEYLCSAEENPRDIFQWVLRWLAFPVQHPGAKMRTALVFHGPQGTGKNLFFETVMAIYGEYGRIVDQSAIEDKFNDWASRKLFLIADEVVARAELFHVKNKLKGLVTGEWIRINPKNVAAHDERNHVNLVFLSNERQPLVLERDDRRYAVIWTPEKLPQTFYSDVKAELSAGGAAALHQHLLDLPLGDFDEYTLPPMTSAKREVIDISLDSAERFVADWQGGEVAAENGEIVPFRPCLGSHLYAIYLRWCRENGVARPRERNQFIGTLSKLRGWTAGKSQYTRDNLLPGAEARNRKMVVPDEAAIKASPVGRGRLSDGSVEPYWREDAEDKAFWLTRSFFGFCQTVGVAP